MNFSSNTKIRAKKDHLNRDTLFVPFKAPVTTLVPSICKLFITNYYQIQNKARLKETKEIENHLQTKHQIDWDSATCITYSTDYHQRLTLESWFTNLEQTPLNRSQQLPAPYKRLIDEMKRN